MNPFFKALVGIVLVAVVAGAGIFYQYKGASFGGGESVGLTQDEMSMFVEKNLGLRERAQLAKDPAARKDMLERLGKQLSLVAEAQNRGLGDTEEAQTLQEFSTAQVLQGVYLDAHPELAGAAQRGGPQASPEEVDAWIKMHSDDIGRYQTAFQAASHGMPAPQPKDFASSFIFADKARAEGLDQKPDTKLQLKLARYGVLYQQMDAALKKETELKDEDVKQYYDEHKGSGDLDQVHLQHILLATVALGPASGPAPDPEAKRVLADQLLTRAKGGEDFAALAQEYSEDPGSKQKGGDLGWAGRFKFVPPFEEAAWKLQPGQVSDVVKTDYGYHIIKMLERKPPEELTPQVTEELKDSLSQRRLEEKVDAIAKNNPVSLPQDFTVTAPEMPPNMPMMPGMEGGAMPDMDMGEDEGAGAPPPAPPAGKAGDAQKPAGKPAAKPAKKGTK